ncbi:Uncharacterised protein [Mycobacteroides abscessus subsp. abscessus]|nr:Uncharacterised protein [Mycobacteroides abscessus subsp. abscessus]
MRGIGELHGHNKIGHRFFAYQRTILAQGRKSVPDEQLLACLELGSNLCCKPCRVGFLIQVDHHSAHLRRCLMPMPNDWADEPGRSDQQLARGVSALQPCSQRGAYGKVQHLAALADCQDVIGDLNPYPPASGVLADHPPSRGHLLRPFERIRGWVNVVERF